MHEAALARAAIPSPCVVLGMLLRPLSLGHVMAMSRDDTLDRASRGTLTPAQVVAATLICCQDWDSISGAASGRFFTAKIKLWEWRVKRTAKRHNAKLKTGHERRGYFEIESEKLIAHFVDGSLEFPASDAPKPDRQVASRQPGAPFALRLQQWLVMAMRMSESEAWDYPFGLAKMRWECHWEQEGGFDVMNEQDESFSAYARARDAAEALAEPKTHHG